MDTKLSIFYAVLLAIISIFTEEIVTFVMLSFVLIALININTTLKKIYNATVEQKKTGL